MNNKIFARIGLNRNEQVQLIIRLMESGQHMEAIRLLLEAVDEDPSDAKLHYLLGAEYAEMALYEQAKEAFIKAIELDPGLELALFQAGLLHLALGEPEQAVEVWQGLAHLEENHYLQLFSNGLTELIGDNFEQSEALLLQGIAANQQITALNRNMELIIAAIQERDKAGAVPLIKNRVIEPDKTEASEKPINSFLIKGYVTNFEDE